MKNRDWENDDRALKELLSAWKISATLPPRFPDQVWNRIASAQSQSVLVASPWAAIKVWLAGLQPRPALVAAYLTALIALGATLGWTQARQATVQANTELSARYVQAVNPYQASQ